MKEWRVIAVLLAIAVLLSVILGVKIMKNTPQKDIPNIEEKFEFTEEYEELEILDINKDAIGSDFMQETDFENSQNIIDSIDIKNILSGISGIIMIPVIIAGLIGLFIVISQYKIYYKLGINKTLVSLSLAFIILTFVTVFFNNILTGILSLVTSVFTIILTVKQYKIIGVNPYLLLLNLIPILGVICGFVVSIIATCKLADYFGKGTGFKIGLIFLPFIFIPILAFSSNE